AAWQTKVALLKSCSLVREDYLSIARLPIGILGQLPLLTTRLGRGNGLAEVGHCLLGRLRVQIGELLLDLSLKVCLRWPPAALLTDGNVALYQPGPKTARLQANPGESPPVLSGGRKPINGYRAISHALSVAQTVPPQQARFKADSRCAV